MTVCRPSARATGGASAGAWAAVTGAGPSPAPSASRQAARGEPASSSPPLRVYRPTASTTSPVTVASRPRQAVAALRVAYPRTVNSGAVPATNTAMVAAPAHGEPEVSARASTDRVTPHGISTDARPSAAGASADCERARPRTNRLHDAGGVTVMPRKPGTPSWASPNTTMRTPAAICAMVRSPTESSTVAPRAPRAAPSRVWEASLPARNPPTGARSSANRPDTDTGADAPAGGLVADRRLPRAGFAASGRAGVVAGRWRVTRPASSPPCTAAQDTPPANSPVTRTATRFTTWTPFARQDGNTTAVRSAGRSMPPGRTRHPPRQIDSRIGCSYLRSRPSWCRVAAWRSTAITGSGGAAAGTGACQRSRAAPGMIAPVRLATVVGEALRQDSGSVVERPVAVASAGHHRDGGTAEPSPPRGGDRRAVRQTRHGAQHTIPAGHGRCGPMPGRRAAACWRSRTSGWVTVTL